MGAIFLAIAPTFVLILMGYALRRGGIPSVEFWNLNDRLVYWVLMPALFFAKISAADLGAQPLGAFAGLLYAGFFAAVGFGLLAQRIAGLPPPQGTDVVQGASRFNTFVGLAIAEALYGAPGLQAAVVGSAILVPVVNVVMVTALALMLRRAGGNLLAGTLRDLARNPLILSIVAGLVFNALGLRHVPVLHETATVLGQAALPVMLLAVGANLKIRGMEAHWVPMILSALGKLVVFPAAVLLAAAVLSPEPLSLDIAIIYGALPVAVSAYTLAREMGGDAPLMAGIITVQTLLSFVTIPVTLVLARWLMG
jgi:malonate transporter and related proteins